MDERCGDCKYFDSDPNNGEVSRCNRYPPGVIAATGQHDFLKEFVLYHGYPKVHEDNWCGEFTFEDKRP